MKAVRFVEVGRPPEVVDIAKPTPGPGEILLRVGGAGVCHSDLHVLDHGSSTPGPFTLGHENAGWIEGLGQGVSGWREGDAVAVYGPWGCGVCHTCQSSAENYCDHHSSLHAFGGGLGADGGMAEYMIVPSPRLLVPLGALDPLQAAPLTDAGLTPYSAIKKCLPLLTPDVSVLVVGVGGLGQMAIQILKALTSTPIIAADVDQDKLNRAKAFGATHLVNTRDSEAARASIQAIVGERGVVVALDFVGIQATIDLCSSLMARASRLSIVGLGGGVVHYSANQPAFGCEVTVPYWGSRTELIEVIALAGSGHLKADVEVFSLEEAPMVYERLRAGKIGGRAVLRP